MHISFRTMIHGFIADFYCEKLNLVVEIDGGVHEQQKDYDALRDEIINLHGIKVMRFTNAEVMGDIGSVLGRIVSYLTPPFPEGEGPVTSPFLELVPRSAPCRTSEGGKGDKGG